MDRISRAEFLGFGALLGGAALGLRGGTTDEPQQTAATLTTEPDVVVVNARVYTSETAQPRAEAIAIKEGRFVAVGSTTDVKNLASRGTQVIDGAGMTVLPGFIDTHCHPSGVNELYSVNANVRTVKELQACVAKEGCGHASRLLGRSLHVRRHQTGRPAAPQASRRSRPGSSGRQ